MISYLLTLLSAEGWIRIGTTDSSAVCDAWVAFGQAEGVLASCVQLTVT